MTEFGRWRPRNFNSPGNCCQFKSAAPHINDWYPVASGKHLYSRSASCAQLIRMICPLLQQRRAFREMRSAIAGPFVRIPYGVGDRVLDQIGTDSKHFVQDRPRRRAKAMSGHHGALDSHAAHGSEHCVGAHWPVALPSLACFTNKEATRRWQCRSVRRGACERWIGLAGRRMRRRPRC